MNILKSKNIKKIHCLGVGGIGVSGIAEFLLHKGYQVSGSDKMASKITKRLEELGITIYLQHAAENIADADLIVYSSAIAADNPEFLAAKQKNILLMQRAEMLAELMEDSKGIAIAGTHGKTTTTSLTSAILLEAGLDPSFMIGGCINNRVSPMCLGQGEYFVVEADESDASFLSLSPEIAIVNNIEIDHIETYNGDFNQLKDTFVKFLHRLPRHGLAILGADDLAVADLIPHLNCPFLTFGFSESADVRATEFRQQGLKSSFVVLRPGCEPFEVNLNLPGKHNVLNALAAITVALHLNIDDQAVLQALTNFSGVGRRFHARGELAIKGGTALVIDDYGHHPGAIVATLDAARLAWPERRIVLAFQPHRYSRTQDLMKEFAAALSKADLLICLEVYSAGESAIPGVNGQALCHAVEQHGMVKPIFVAEIDQLPARLQEILQPNDILLMQGAGDISLMAIQLGSASDG